MTNGDWLPVQAPFDLVRRGFSPEQVTAHLERLEYDLRIATANRDASAQRLTELSAQLATAQSEVDGLRTQLDRAVLEPVSMSGLSDRMQRMIRLAEEEAGDIRARAQTDADRLRGQLEIALTEAAETRQAFDSERERTRKQLAEQVHGLIAEAGAEADDTRTQAQAEAARLLQDANAQAERTVLDARDYAAKTTTDADRAAEAGVAQAREQAERTVAEADQRAEHTIAQADQQAERTVAEADQRAEHTIAQADQQAADTTGAADAAAQTLTQHTAAERERLDAASLARRTQVDNDFDIAFTARRTEAVKSITDRESTSAASAEKVVADATEKATTLVSDAQAESDLLLARATTYANALVNRAAAESKQRVGDADQAVSALQDLRSHLNDQLKSLTAHLDHIRNLAGSAPDLLTAPTKEAGRPRAEQFPADPVDRPTDVGPAPVLRTGPRRDDENDETAHETPVAIVEDAPADAAPAEGDAEPDAAEDTVVAGDSAVAVDSVADSAPELSKGASSNGRDNGSTARIRAFGQGRNRR